MWDSGAKKHLRRRQNVCGSVYISLPTNWNHCGSIFLLLPCYCFFVVVVFDMILMEKHLHLQKSIKQVPWYSPFGPLYSWKYHSNTMVCEVQYPYKRVLCSTAVQKMVLDGNTMEMYLEMYFATEIHVPWCFWKCMVLSWYKSKILELQ